MGLSRERIEDGGGDVRHQGHVGFVDVFPTGNGGAVEHDAVFERVFVHHIGTHGQVLPLAARVGKAQVNELDVVFLDDINDVGSGFAIKGHRQVSLSL